MKKNLGSIRGRPLVVTPPTVDLSTESRAMSEWGYEATRWIKERMLSKRWGYGELAEALQSQGIRRSPGVINRRINRQNFGAGFFLACLFVLSDEEGKQPGQAEMNVTKS